MQATQVLTVMLLSMTIAVVLFGFAMLVARKSQRPDQEWFLAIFLGVYCLIKLDALYLHSKSYLLLPHLAGIMFSVKLILPPLFFFYARALMSPEIRWVTRKDAHALLAPLCATLLAVPYYVLSAEQKIALMDPLLRDPRLYERAVLGCQIALLLFVVVSLVYLRAAFALFKRHSQKMRMLFSQIDDKNLAWLRWLLLAICIGWTVYGIGEVMALSGYLSKPLFMGLMTFDLIWLSLIAFFGIRQVPVYASLDTLNEVNASHLKNQSREETNKQVYARSGLDDTTRSQIAQRLEQAMAQDKLFQQPELSLRDLALAIEVPETSISETFSQSLHTNFFDFVNRHRVQQACVLLKCSQQTILAIALESGFNSRSTFNAAFKKHIGETPSQYRNRAQQLSSSRQ